MRDHQKYIDEVDAELAKLRAKCLGQDLSFEVLLPEDSWIWKAEDKASYITQQLLFALAKVEPNFSIPPELEESSTWLYALILFLETKCNPADRTFASIKRILDLDETTREFMFEDKPFKVLQTLPPFLLQRFDLGVLQLLDSRGLLSPSPLSHFDLPFGQSK